MSSKIRINLYCDEIEEVNIHDPITGDEKWIYIGVLIVPVSLQEKLILTLLNRRCGNRSKLKKAWGDCENQCEYHEKNNKEVHYHGCDSHDIFFIAERWLEFLMQDRKLTYFYILGIDLGTLDLSYFGDVGGYKAFERIYNRFFRTAILKSVKSYFHKYERIEIYQIIHDVSQLGNSEFFPWHAIYRIGREDEKIQFLSQEIEFLTSDHRKAADSRSHLIQYIDIIMGSIFNALHWSSKNKNKEKISLSVDPLLYRLMYSPGNVNSRYQYVGRQSIDFFPKKTFECLFDIDKKSFWENSFYKKRELRIRRAKQPMLFNSNNLKNKE